MHVVGNERCLKERAVTPCSNVSRKYTLQGASLRITLSHVAQHFVYCEPAWAPKAEGKAVHVAAVVPASA